MVHTSLGKCVPDCSVVQTTRRSLQANDSSGVSVCKASFGCDQPATSPLDEGDDGRGRFEPGAGPVQATNDRQDNATSAGV